MEKLFTSRQSGHLDFDVVRCKILFRICTFDLACTQLFRAKKKVENGKTKLQMSRTVLSFCSNDNIN